MMTKKNPVESIKSSRSFSMLPIALSALLIGGCRKSEFDKAVEEDRTQSQKYACIANLKQLEGAIEQCKLSGKENPSYTDIYGPTGFIKTESFCSIDKTKRYAIPVGSDRPVCPNNGKGHTLD